uniref:Uncharacterized protein n=1 Tax=Oncorhynchus tshawytscha TaxID=74940 RepID=A0A8C8LVD2_ONCTS
RFSQSPGHLRSMRNLVKQHTKLLKVQDQSSNATGNYSHRSDGPEPQRNRQLLFSKVTEKSREKFISDASFHIFVHTFNPFYKKNPQVTENIHKQLRKYIQRTFQLRCKLDHERESVSEFHTLSSSLCPPATFDDPEYSPVLKQIGKGDT